ncbi:MAG: HAMP domain-containing sensor histidine kinase [Pseudomonadota bacterium]
MLDTVSSKTPESDSFPIVEDEAELFWTARLSLRARILAVNVFAIAVLAGGFFYLDNYRNTLLISRQADDERQVAAAVRAYDLVPEAMRADLLTEIAQLNGFRVRVYGENGIKLIDTFSFNEPTYELRDPDKEPWKRHVARFLDRSVDTIVRAPRRERFVEPDNDILSAWEEASLAAETAEPVTRARYAPDRTFMLSAAAKAPQSGHVMLITRNARTITAIVRDQRLALGIIIACVLIVSVLLSLFLARTIVKPLTLLASAANRVRLGRERDVEVPRLPERGDEIGQLARALSDMTEALRKRIDATESFAADVSHEIKNPLASLRSALEGLERVKDPKLRKQLHDIACSDVLRLDRLITDISEASRVDAQLARTRFEPIDMGEVIDQLLKTREERDLNHGREIAFARPRKGVAVVMGEGTRLARVIDNLLDNAVSFSPEKGLVEIVATRDRNQVIIRIMDNGPGVPESQREAIFRRFHSYRDEGEAFGQHSGLGLAIARSIIEGHEGQLIATDRPDGARGAHFCISLPAIFAQKPIIGSGLKDEP